MEIFAHHAHVFPKQVREQGTIERLRSLMDDCGIAAAVCFAPFSYQLKGVDIEGNKWLYEQLNNQSNLYGFGTIDFSKVNLKEQVQRIYDFGFKGIKLHPAVQKFDILSPDAFEIYEKAEELGLFLTFHTGIHWYRIHDYAVVKFDEIAYHFQNLKFSMEHVGGYHFFNEALAVMMNNLHGRPQKVFGGLTSVFTPEHNRHWHLSEDKLNELIAQAKCDTLIFGLDFPYNMEEETKIGIQTLQNLPISKEEKQLILGGNLKRELGL